MPLYTFYFRRPDGAAITLDMKELRDDAAASQRAVALLADHRSCDHVSIWCGEREVMASQRESA